MLVEFSVKNFMSFKDKVTFSMEATTGTEKEIWREEDDKYYVVLNTYVNQDKQSQINKHVIIFMYTNKGKEKKMSILNIASSRSVYRGYDYYKNGNVISYIQLSDFEYEGKVQGINKEAYHVMINTKHPKSSSCDCSFANGNTICKHMVALFFAISPEDLKDYEDWSENGVRTAMKSKNSSE